MPELITKLSYYGRSKIFFDFRGYIENSKGKEMVSVIRINHTDIPIISKMHNLQGICRDYIIYPIGENLKIKKSSDFYFYGTVKDLEIDYNGNCPFGNLDLKEFRDKHILRTPKNSSESFYYKMPLKEMDLNYNKSYLIPLIFKKLEEKVKKDYNSLKKVSLKFCLLGNISKKFVGYPLDFQENAKKSGHFYWFRRE